MKTADSFVMLEPLYQTSWHCVPENSTLELYAEYLEKH
jgi:hypothetical protein